MLQTVSPFKVVFDHRMHSPGTTRFHRRPDSVSYCTGEAVPPDRGLSEPCELESDESRSSLAVEGLVSMATVSENWPWNARCGSDDDESP